MESQTIRLRNWTAEDASQLAHIANNKKIWDNLRDSFPHPYSIEDAKAFIAMNSDTSATHLAIEYNGRVAGGIGYMPQDDIERVSAEVGYYLGQEFWGKGILVEALHLLSEKIFSQTEILRLFAIPCGFNTASMRVLDKAGWRKVGVLKNAAIKNGNIIDLHYYELAKEID